MRNKILRILREPVVLFFLFGFIFFLVYTILENRIDRSDREIIISKAQIQLLEETFTKTWNRPPTEQQLEEQIENLIKNEVYFKEAVAMGLDNSDPAVKMRLRTLIEMMMDDMATVYPSEDQLKKYLSEHPDKFRIDPRMSFEHIFFPEDEKEVADLQLYNINNNLSVDESSFGNLSLIPAQFSNETYSGVKRTFGEVFAEGIFKLDTGKWQGPVRSAYGWHLVFISEYVAGKLPELSEIWDLVEREWSFEQRNLKKEEQYQKMKEEYYVKFETEE